MPHLELKLPHGSRVLAPLRLPFLPLFIAVVTFALPACQRNQTAAVERLIVATPESSSSLMTDVPRFVQWEHIFTTQGHVTPKWKFHHLKITSGEKHPDQGPKLIVTGAAPIMVIKAKIEAADTAYLELEGSGLSDRARLFWAASGEAFEPERSVAATAIQPGRNLRFDVKAHPQWSEVIDRLRIELHSKIGSSFSPHSIRAIGTTGTPEYLASLSENPYVVELDGTIRPSRFLIPGFPLEWHFNAQTGDRLQFFTGTPALSAGDSHLRINIECSEIGSTTLYDFPLQDGDLQTWVEHEIAIPITSDSDVTLRFETTPRGTSDSSLDLTILGNPTVFRESPEAEYPNLILVSIDTLRADHVSSYGYARETTPELDAFFENKGTIFKNVVAGAPWTLPSHVTMLSGLNAINHGANFDDIPDPSAVVFLAETLRSHGYTSAAWTGGGFLSPSFGFSSGFDRYSSWPAAHSDNELIKHAEEVQAWITANRNHRFFVMLHTYEVHTPFRPREPYFSRFRGKKPGIDGFVDTKNLSTSPDDGFISKKAFQLVKKDGQPPSTPVDPDLLTDLYDAGIAYTDSILGKLLKELSDKGILANTLVVITSDHGESLGEKNLFGHGNLYDGNLMVPLLMAGPGIQAGDTQIENQVGLVDLTPTLLDLMGISQSNYVDGISLLPMLKGDTAKAPGIAWSYSPKTNRGIAARVGNREKLILNNSAWAPAFDHTEYYDLIKDPAELRDLGGQTNPELKMLTEKTLDGSPHGLEISFSNNTEQQINAVFGFEKSDYLLVFKVKGEEVPPSSLKIGPGRAFTVTLDGGAVIKLLLEGITTRDLSVVGSGPSTIEKSLDHLIDLPGMVTPNTLYYDGNQWRQSSQSPPDSPLSIRLAWRSGQPLESQPSMIRDTLKKQLEALGYVE